MENILENRFKKFKNINILNLYSFFLKILRECEIFYDSNEDSKRDFPTLGLLE